MVQEAFVSPSQWAPPSILFPVGEAESYLPFPQHGRMPCSWPDASDLPPREGGTLLRQLASWCHGCLESKPSAGGVSFPEVLLAGVLPGRPLHVQKERPFGGFAHACGVSLAACGAHEPWRYSAALCSAVLGTPLPVHTLTSVYSGD